MEKIFIDNFYNWERWYFLVFIFLNNQTLASLYYTIWPKWLAAKAGVSNMDKQ